jgi:DNA invertase Pin-like site-specific DNA recombinase
MTVAAYVRVSTTDQNLDRQLEGVTEYAQRELTVDADDLQYFRDKSTGTDVDRSGYQALADAVEAGEVDTVVVLEVSRIARSIRDLERTVDRFREAGAELHIVEERLVVQPGEEDPYQRALFQMLGVFAELEAKIKRENIRQGIAARQESEEYRHGPAPLGFEKNDGALVEGDQYQRVVEILEQVARGEVSKRQASKELDTSRRTVQRSVEDRADLYGL